LSGADAGQSCPASWPISASRLRSLRPQPAAAAQRRREGAEGRAAQDDRGGSDCIDISFRRGMTPLLRPGHFASRTGCCAAPDTGNMEYLRDTAHPNKKANRAVGSSALRTRGYHQRDEPSIPCLGGHAVEARRSCHGAARRVPCWSSSVFPLAPRGGGSNCRSSGVQDKVP
jgi:hypothetical protein